MDKAKETNEEALSIDYENIVTLGNRAFLEWYSGTNLTPFLERLKKLYSEPYFPEKELNARAVQANLLYHLSGCHNVSCSIQIYEDLIQKRPENYHWKYQLGVALRQSRNKQENSQIEHLFRDVEKNTTSNYLKRAALSELALLSDSHQAVEELAKNSEHLDRDYPVIMAKFGKALSSYRNTRGLLLLKKSVSLKENATTRYFLAKAYCKHEMTRHLDREESIRRALFNFQRAYDLSMKLDITILRELAYFLLTTYRTEEAIEKYSFLSKTWSKIEIYTPPLFLAYVFQSFYRAISRRWGKDPLLGRYRMIALIALLEAFKQSSPPSEQSILFNKIIDPTGTSWGDDFFSKSILILFKGCNDQNCAKQILARLKQQETIGDSASLKIEFENLLSQGKTGEAILMLDTLGLQERNIPIVPESVQRKVILKEAHWQLSQGLISCKQLFHRVFNMCYSNLLDEDGDGGETSDTEVIILHDSQRWKPFLQNNTELSADDPNEFTEHPTRTMYEEVIQYLFDLEAISNPWLSFSGSNGLDEEAFSTLLNKFKVRLVLLIVDDDSSQQFLHMIDGLLAGPATEATTQEGKPNVAVVCNGNNDFKAKIPRLENVRTFHAPQHGFVLRAGSKPVTDLIGDEMIEKYFSGDENNALDFFRFLAPDSDE